MSPHPKCLTSCRLLGSQDESMTVREETIEYLYNELSRSDFFTSCPAVDCLHLKVGAQVMLLKNLELTGVGANRML
eukprot:scaffold648745_cov45-Prasinocladus_malaysianus.AAC.1